MEQNQLSLVLDNEGKSEKNDDVSLLSTLLEDSRLYRTSKEYMELLDFVGRMKRFAPFNAMLLQIQKPGLSYAATPREWMKRFNRTIKEGSRPMLIMWPFSPVELVYDVSDTEGDDLPERALDSFVAYGEVNKSDIDCLITEIERKHIYIKYLDVGDNNCGNIKLLKNRTMVDGRRSKCYQLGLNKNHKYATQLVTILHELGHLFLGHLGGDSVLKIKDRSGLSHSQVEMEAESVAYVLAKRFGVDAKSEAYLSNFIEKFEENNRLDIYKIMMAAGKVETVVEKVLKNKAGQ